MIVQDLPITSLLPAVGQSLAEQPNLVLQAPPGAGKTTAVPLALLNARWRKKKILMLEPRRLAAKNAAWWMSKLLGEKVGGTVGYRIHLDSKISSKTQIEVVTEGILTRMIQGDPELSEYSLVIFDEFHERSLDADLGLALCLESQEVLRPDLRLMVMSATLDGGPVAELMGDAKVLTSPGKAYPVEIRYSRTLPVQWRDQQKAVAGAVQSALEEETGSILVFLPGMGEIRQVEDLLKNRLPDNTDLCPLYSSLDQRTQERAIAPAESGRRKVVLATTIAESSLTIEGVRIVIDCGLTRKPKYHPSSGLTFLETLSVSQASADQRTGRAGRTAPGVSIRLWPESTRLVPFDTPEIAQADLAGLVLSLAAWGCSDPGEMRWLQPPSSGSFSQAEDLLHWLGVLDRDGRITEEGRAVNRLGIHPRLGRMILQAEEYAWLACDLAALLQERDLLSDPGVYGSDIRIRLEALYDEQGFSSVKGVHQGVKSRIRMFSKELMRRVKTSRPENPQYHIEHCASLLALAYPDRVALSQSSAHSSFHTHTHTHTHSREQNRTYAFAGGGSASFRGFDPLSRSESGSDYLIVPVVSSAEGGSRIQLAAPLTLETIKELFSKELDLETSIEWSREKKRFFAYESLMLGRICLERSRQNKVNSKAYHQAFLTELKKQGIDYLPWSKKAEGLRKRLAFLHAHLGEQWPSVSDQALLDHPAQWLEPYLGSWKYPDPLDKLPLFEALKGMVPWDLAARLEEYAPTHYTAPSGSRIPITYNGEDAVLPVRLQELFGLTETPRIGGDQIPVTVHLLSPARRPVQITKDLAGFWKNTYRDVKKDLMGRYPKHYWPDDPLSAVPTNRTKPGR